jgi:uncharacterized protein YkwD
VGGAINYDYDNDGAADTWFEPTAEECLQLELVNVTRATHDVQGAPECHAPLGWSVEWAAHGRNHSIKQAEQGQLFHEDFPYGQNCAMAFSAEQAMDLYMNGANEPHCPELSHHCNIMRCTFSQIGIGMFNSGGYLWQTQNFL